MKAFPPKQPPNSKAERGLDVNTISASGPADGGERVSDVIAGKEMAVASSHNSPRCDRVGGIEVHFRSDEAAELWIAAVGSRLPRIGGAACTTASPALRIEKIVVISQPEQMII